MQKIRKKVFDNHSHIGPVPGFAYYGLPEAVKPTTDYDTIDEYLKQDHIHEIIISCWDNESITDENKWCKDVVEEDYELIEPHLDKVTFIKNKYPKDLKNIYNIVSYFRQINTLAALKKAKTKYCVVHKAGDSFPDMSAILNKFKIALVKAWFSYSGIHG